MLSLCLSHLQLPLLGRCWAWGHWGPSESIAWRFTPGAQAAVGNESHVGWLWACRGQDKGRRRAPVPLLAGSHGPYLEASPLRPQFSCR